MTLSLKKPAKRWKNAKDYYGVGERTENACSHAELQVSLLMPHAYTMLMPCRIIGKPSLAADRETVTRDDSSPQHNRKTC
jgi:hypothetical protein